MIVASTLAAATLVSCAAATMPAMAVQARSATSQTVTFAATDMLSAAELKYLNDNKDTVSTLIPGFDPAVSDYYGVPKDKIASAAAMIPMAGIALASAPVKVDTAKSGYLVDGKVSQTAPESGDVDYQVAITGKTSNATVLYTLHTAAKPTTDPDNGNGDKPLTGDTDGDGQYTGADLKGVTVTVTVDGKGSPLADWDPAKSDYTIPAGARVVLNGVPEGWTMQEKGGADASSVFDLTSPDGAATFTYTFTPEGSQMPDPDKPGTGGNNGTGDDNGGSDTVKPTVKPLSIDLSKDTTSGHGVYVTDGTTTPKGDKASDPLYGAWDLLEPGTYAITYKQAGEGGEGAQSVRFTHREHATLDKDGIIDLGLPVKENSVLNVKDASATSDTVDPATVRVTVKEGDVLLFPSSKTYTFGTVTFTPEGSDQNQDQQGGDGQNQKPGADQDQDQDTPAGDKNTQSTSRNDGNTLPATGVTATGVGLGSLIALLMAGLAMLGIKRRA